MDAPLTAAPASLLSLLKASIVEQQAADALRFPASPIVCGDARIGGQHHWTRAPGFATWRILTCECGARAREDHDGRLTVEAA